MVTLVKDLQPPKALCEITLIGNRHTRESGMVTRAKEQHVFQS